MISKYNSSLEEMCIVIRGSQEDQEPKQTENNNHKIQGTLDKIAILEIRFRKKQHDVKDSKK